MRLVTEENLPRFHHKALLYVSTSNQCACKSWRIHYLKLFSHALNIHKKKQQVRGSNRKQQQNQQKHHAAHELFMAVAPQGSYVLSNLRLFTDETWALGAWMCKENAARLKGLVA